MFYSDAQYSVKVFLLSLLTLKGPYQSNKAYFFVEIKGELHFETPIRGMFLFG